MDELYTLKELTPSELAERRARIHTEHLDYFYGDFWSMYIDKKKTTTD